MAEFPWFPHYPEGVPHDCRAPVTSLWQLLEAVVDVRPDAPALVYDNHIFSYRQLRDQALRAASAIGPGDRPVVIALPNVPAFAEAFFGAQSIGRIVVPLSPQLTEGEVRQVLEDTQADVVVIPQDDDRYRAVLSETGIRQLSATSHLPPVASTTESGPDDLAVLQYTSGTTGGPKAAMMSHANLIANAWQNNIWFRWSADDVVAGALPLCHTWGMSCVLVAAITAGASIVLFDDTDPGSMLQAIQRYRVSIIYGSATLFERLLDGAGDRAGEVFASCRYVKAGAMLVGSHLPERWASSVPAVPMELGYGLTEASPEVCDNPPQRHKEGTVGVPLPGTEVRTCSPDDPVQELPVDTVGEIQVRGPQVTEGYWRQPKATKETILPDGWLRTGDLGRLDAEGYLTIVDRLKDLIKFRGWSVVPAEVERALRAHPHVRDVVVVGRPHETDGEETVACIIPAEGASLTGDELDGFLHDRLARFKRPRHYQFVSEIPKNAVGKPLRRELRALVNSPR